MVRIAMRVARMKKGLTQKELAEMIDMTPQAISNIEHGKYYPIPTNMNKIAKALGSTVQELFFEEN